MYIYRLSPILQRFILPYIFESFVQEQAIHLFFLTRTATTYGGFKKKLISHRCVWLCYYT